MVNLGCQQAQVGKFLKDENTPKNTYVTGLQVDKSKSIIVPAVAGIHKEKVISLKVINIHVKMIMRMSHDAC